MAKKESQKETQELSKSKAKREERQKEIKKEKKQKLIGKIISIVVTVAIVGVFAVAIGYNVYKAAIRTTSGTDYAACLTDTGLIQGVDTTSDVTLADYENLVVPKNEVSATTEEVDADIQSTLSSNEELKEDNTIQIADGDKVNIDYVGTVNGVEFEGGNSNGEGYDLTIGSETFIDDFEQQLIGHKPGEDITVNVTFPDDYSESDLAGKDAEFTVTIHGVYVTPELTDEFVQTHFPDVASTADEYRKSVEDKFYEQHLQEYLNNYIIDNSTINTYPTDYVKNLKSITKSNDEYTLSYYNQMFSQYGMDSTYQNVWDTREGIDNEIDYEHELTERAKEVAAQALIYQAIYEKAGLSVDFDALIAEMTETYGEESVNSMKETYGQGYMIQSEIQSVVMKYLVENANVQ